MNKYIIVALLFLSQTIYAQKTISKSYTITREDNSFSISKVYNKETGKKVKPKKFKELIEKNPNLPLEPVYNKKGEIIKYFYNPELRNAKKIKYRANPPEIGEDYPNIEFKTVDGKTIELANLKGKLVILRFELDALGFRFKKNEIDELDKKINDSGKKEEIEAIIIFAAPKKDVEKGFDQADSNFNAVANGSNFQDILQIKRFPFTVVIDKQGKLLDYYNMSDRIDIVKLLEE